MPDTTTKFGLPYPLATDHTRLWEHFEALADAVDGLPIPPVGSVLPLRTWAGALPGTGAISVPTQVTATFPVGLFTVPPVVVACFTSGQFGIISIISVTTANFVASYAPTGSSTIGRGAYIAVQVGTFP